MNERDKELWKQSLYDGDTTDSTLFHFADLIRADERADLIKFFENHWRSDWSDGQIIETLEARWNT